MRYANGDDHLHLHQAMQLYAEWPSELVDRIQDSDTVYLQQNQLTYEQSTIHCHLLQNFDLMELTVSHHQNPVTFASLDNSYAGS
jgi:hypothetical protein